MRDGEGNYIKLLVKWVLFNALCFTYFVFYQNNKLRAGLIP